MRSICLLFITPETFVSLVCIYDYLIDSEHLIPNERLATLYRTAIALRPRATSDCGVETLIAWSRQSFPCRKSQLDWL